MFDAGCKHSQSLQGISRHVNSLLVISVCIVMSIVLTLNDALNKTN
jgi:hypothetical protein